MWRSVRSSRRGRESRYAKALLRYGIVIGRLLPSFQLPTDPLDTRVYRRWNCRRINITGATIEALRRDRRHTVPISARHRHFTQPRVSPISGISAVIFLIETSRAKALKERNRVFPRRISARIWTGNSTGKGSTRLEIPAFSLPGRQESWNFATIHVKVHE